MEKAINLENISPGFGHLAPATPEPADLSASNLELKLRRSVCTRTADTLRSCSRKCLLNKKLSSTVQQEIKSSASDIDRSQRDFSETAEKR